MGTTTIIYDAKCKDCHFHQRHKEGKRTVTKCLSGYQKVRVSDDSDWYIWNYDQKEAAMKTTLKSKACNDFILWETPESRVYEILKERKA